LQCWEQQPRRQWRHWANANYIGAKIQSF
jgi:hypothetical protein